MKNHVKKAKRPAGGTASPTTEELAAQAQRGNMLAMIKLHRRLVIGTGATKTYRTPDGMNPDFSAAISAWSGNAVRNETETIMNMRTWRSMSHQEKVDWFANHQPHEVANLKRRVKQACHRRAISSCYRDLGMVRVRGSGGGTYWE